MFIFRHISFGEKDFGMSLLGAVLLFKEESSSRPLQGCYSMSPVHNTGLPQELLKTAAEGYTPDEILGKPTAE